MADIYVLVDGDDTYDATSVARLIEPLLYGQVDMVNAVRVATAKDAFISPNFSSECTDVLSGYRAMSRRFVKSFPALSQGFEIESSPFMRSN